MDMIQDWMIINKIKMGDPDAWDILVHKLCSQMLWRLRYSF